MDEYHGNGMMWWLWEDMARAAGPRSPAALVEFM